MLDVGEKIQLEKRWQTSVDAFARFPLAAIDYPGAESLDGFSEAEGMQ